MTSRWPRPTGLTWVAIVATLGAITATAGYLLWVYPSLPEAVPIRFIRGRAVIYQFKTPLLVLLPVLVQAALAGVIGALLLVLLWRARPGDDFTARPEDAERMRHAAEGIALLGAVWIGFQGFGAFRLVTLWQRGSGGFGEVYTAALVTAIVVSVVIGARTLKQVGREPAGEPSGDHASWRLGRLYVNRRDPALFVPTRVGVGWTLNFGRPMAILVMAGTLGVGIGVPFYIAWLVLKGLLR
ncbi:MAG: DUF5808 domain-containing protein [Vicinamibacterales bacterium]